MSWSVRRVGLPPAVRARLAQDFAAVKCAEPEESVKSGIAAAVDAALAAFPPELAVEVTASGSQYCPDSTKPDEKQNEARLELKPLYGFVL